MVKNTIYMVIRVDVTAHVSVKYLFLSGVFLLKKIRFTCAYCTEDFSNGPKGQSTIPGIWVDIIVKNWMFLMLVSVFGVNFFRVCDYIYNRYKCSYWNMFQNNTPVSSLMLFDNLL